MTICYPLLYFATHYCSLLFLLFCCPLLSLTPFCRSLLTTCYPDYDINSTTLYLSAAQRIITHIDSKKCWRRISDILKFLNTKSVLAKYSTIPTYLLDILTSTSLPRHPYLDNPYFLD